MIQDQRDRKPALSRRSDGSRNGEIRESTIYAKNLLAAFNKAIPRQFWQLDQTLFLDNWKLRPSFQVSRTFSDTHIFLIAA